MGENFNENQNNADAINQSVQQNNPAFANDGSVTDTNNQQPVTNNPNVFPYDDNANSGNAGNQNTLPNDGGFNANNQNLYANNTNTYVNNNNGAPQSFIPNQAQNAYMPYPVAVKKNYVLLVIALAFVGLAGIAAALLFLLKGGSSYEKAERNAFSSLFEATGELKPMSSEYDLTLTVESGLFDLLGMGGGAQSFSVAGEQIFDGTDYFTEFSFSEGGGEAFSVLMWQLSKEGLILQMPELSEYFITFGEAASTAYTDELDQKELMKTLNKIADAYFNLAKDAPKTSGVDAEVGGLTQKCDKYTIEIDQKFVGEFCIAAFEAMLENDDFMDFCDKYFAEILSTLTYEFDDYSDARSLFEDLLDELEDMRGSYDDDVYITMDVFVSGKNIVKRVIKFDNGTEDFVVTFGSIKNKSEFSDEFTFDYDGVNVTVKNEGKTEKDKSTGVFDAVVSIENGFYRYSMKVEYDDLRVDDNGLFEGNIELSIPEITLRAVMESELSGDTQNMTGSVSLGGMKLLSLDYSETANTGNKISEPSLSRTNTLDVSNENDLEELMYVIEDVLGSLGLDESVLESIIGSGFSMDDITGVYNGLDDYNYDDNDYDDYNYGDYSFYGEDSENWTDEEWEAYFNEILGEDWDYGYDYDYSEDYYDYEDYYGYDDQIAEIEYMNNLFRGLWKTIIGADWDEALWEEMVAYLGDEVLYLDEYGWLDLWYSVGIDIYDIYWEISDVMQNAEIDVDDQTLMSYSKKEMEDFWRDILRENGFNF